MTREIRAHRSYEGGGVGFPRTGNGASALRMQTAGKYTNGLLKSLLRRRAVGVFEPLPMWFNLDSAARQACGHR